MLWDDYWYDLTFDYTKYNPIDKTNTVCSSSACLPQYIMFKRII